ncbi:MAG TPA: DedA family protein [Usitatibacter sp.]|nr:DedA family protein [Usitatibacter sp.]
MHLDIPYLIDTYGYVTVAAGAFLEGETILALAGLAAHRGYLELWIVIVIAAIAGFTGDQVFFMLGRYHGATMLKRFPDVAKHAERFDAMLAKWHMPLIIGIRFMYGFRIAGPILLGMGSVKHSTFAFYNGIGAIIWANLIAGLGFLFGEALEAALHDMHHWEKWGFAGLLLIGLVVWAIERYKEKKAAREAEETGP